MGWHRHPVDEVLLCPRCWGRAYIVRAVTIPVAGPVDGSWAELAAALKSCWQGATSVANWAVTQLRLADVVRTPQMERLPKMPRVYLYPEARRLYPDVDPRSLTQILRSAEAVYRKSRYAAVWQLRAAVPTFRYPYPYPVSHQGWGAHHDAARNAIVAVRLGGRGWSLRLRGGPSFRRQREAFDQIVGGDAVPATLAIFPQSANRGDHRSGLVTRGAHFRVMARLVAWLPRPSVAARTGTALLRTGGASFWTAAFDSREWHLHGDQVRTWVEGHRRRLDRWRDDATSSVAARHAVRQLRERAAARQQRRLDSFCQQAVAALVDWVARQGVRTVSYDDTDRSFVRSFPWHALRARLEVKLDERGIALEPAASAAERADVDGLGTMRV
jgi:hypothetical protein